MKYYECHGHIVLGDNSIEEKIKLLCKNEVVYFRDGGAKEELYQKCAKTAEEIKSIARDNGIDFVSPVYAFFKEGLYGKYLGKAFTDTKDFYKKVQEVKKLGASYIKVMYSGIASFKNVGQLACDPLSKEEIKEIVNICHGEGMAVMAHCNGVNTIKYAIEYGTDSIEHGIFIDDEGIEMLLQSEGKTIWVPTAVAITNDTLRKNHLEYVKKALDKGAIVALGSDCGASNVDIGSGSASEYEMIGSSKAYDNCMLIKERFGC